MAARTPFQESKLSMHWAPLSTSVSMSSPFTITQIKGLKRNPSSLGDRRNYFNKFMCASASELIYKFAFKTLK